MNTLPRSLVINRAAISRILEINPRKIEDFELQFDELVQVRLKPGRDKRHKLEFIPLAKLEEEFHNFRKEGAKGLVLLTSRPSILSKGGIIHRVEGAGGDIYLLEETKAHLSCTCEDWHQHTTICKHGWAVLNAHGASSLTEMRQQRSNHEQQQLRQNVMPFGRSKPKAYKGVPIE